MSQSGRGWWIGVLPELINIALRHRSSHLGYLKPDAAAGTRTWRAMRWVAGSNAFLGHPSSLAVSRVLAVREAGTLLVRYAGGAG